MTVALLSALGVTEAVADCQIADAAGGEADDRRTAGTGGHGSIADVRNAANAKSGDRYAKALISLGLMLRMGHDD